MVALPASLTPHTVVIRDLLGNGSNGEVFDQPREVTRCKVEDKRRLLRDASGSTRLATGRVFLRPEAGPIVEGSEITLWPETPQERVTRAMEVEFFDHPPAPSYYAVAVG